MAKKKDSEKAEPKSEETPQDDKAAEASSPGVRVEAPVEVEATEVKVDPAPERPAAQAEAREPLSRVLITQMSLCMRRVKDMAEVRRSISEYWNAIPAEERKELVQDSLDQAQRIRLIAEAMEQEFQSIARQ